MPRLVEIATDPQIIWADSDSPEVWAPTHAMHLSGRLRAVSAVPSLIALLEEEEEADWIRMESSFSGIRPPPRQKGSPKSVRAGAQSPASLEKTKKEKEKEKMTPKERWLAVLNREKPDRLPMDYWATEEATRSVMQHLGCSDRWEMFDRLHIDPVVTVAPRYVGPPVEPGYDMYGCRYENVDYGSGLYRECIYHPLAQYSSTEKIERGYTWPSADWFDYSVVADQVKGKERYPIRGGGSEPFLTYKDLRGMEQAYMDLVIHPDLVHYCLDRLFDFCYENTLRIYEQIPGQVDISYVAEDFGGQESLLISPKMIREFFSPRMKRMIELAHQAGVYAFFHSDGAVRDIIPDMIEIGIDVLNPIQWRCKGMERQWLKRDFGGQVIFHGGVDNQYTLAFGSVEEVREEVITNIQVLGDGGGYILAPCHNIQVVSPPENVAAMYKAGYEYKQT